MKIYSVLIMLLFFLTGCYSYKNVASDELTANKSYKIKTNQGRFKKIKIDSIKENVVFYRENNKVHSLKISEKSNIRLRQFSIAKTIILPVGIIGGIVIIFNNAMNNIGKNINLDIQPPP